ncbi:MAG: hypothetical protein FE78DRAFT_66190 [Acidomyces sp. 'richmondensis']|nr:MAG: hypothetical protein FE78DRAFT_66190 [Acidomyces sp. 'richmondensis']
MTATSCGPSDSAEHLDYYPSGSPLFSQPGEVDLWCQSVDFGGFPPTPPETVYDCAVSDCADTMNKPFCQDIPPEESWTTGPALANTRVQSSGSGWHCEQMTQNIQDVRAVDPSTWLNMSHGSVGTGSSPALSYESLSSHTLYSLSEPDVAILPAGLDLSFATDPCWTPDVPSVCQGSHALQFTVPDGNFGLAQSQAQFGMPMAIHASFAAPQPGTAQVQHSVYLDHGQFTSSRYAPVISRRPLLPRTEGSAVPSQPACGPQRVLRPQMPVSQSSQSSLSTVSSMPGQSYGPVMRQQSSVTSPDPASVSSSVDRILPTAEGFPALSRTDFKAHSRSTDRAGQPDPAEEWNSFVHLEQEASNTPAGSFSYATGQVPTQGNNNMVSTMDVKPIVARREPDGQTYQGTTTGTTSLPGDEEGRHRTHPLYNEGPKADGLYHCPYEDKPDCQHKPTKLKCNYDKFIDSHIKPFRCKVEACAKQEFSSTACLLRHEREAHGMHGHGDRPHLCFYRGCERGIAGNGFPRRYNLFDHMKRVHDHNEAQTSLTGSPFLDGKLQTRRAGRKRKVQDSPDLEPDAQRPKTIPGQDQQQPRCSLPLYAGFVPGSTPQYLVIKQDQQRCQSIHQRQQFVSQWQTQRDAIAKQMERVQSPDDEANLQELSQSVQKLRRLSQEARRG